MIRRKFLAPPLIAIILAFSSSAYAEIKVEEPEFLNSYVHLTSDSTYNKLPKETAQFKKHESKASKWAKIGGAAASVAGAAGLGVASASGSVGGLVGGLRTMGAASSVESIVGTIGSLNGFEGMDLVFPGVKSPYVVRANEDVRIILKVESNETDPMDFLRVCQLKTGKKDRKIRWMNYSPTLLGGEEERDNGYLAFDAKKYGKSSYLLIIPADQLEEGEYAIVSPSLVDAVVLPVATFSVK